MATVRPTAVLFRKSDGVARGQIRSKKGTLSSTPKHLDRQYRQDKQVLLDQFWKDRSAKSGTSFGSDFCFSCLVCKVT